MVTDGASHAGESDAFVPFRVAQKPKYAEEFVRVLYIKPHTIIANKEYDLTLVASAPDPDHSRVVETHALVRGVKIGKTEAYYGFAPKFDPAPELGSLHQNYKRVTSLSVEPNPV